MEYAIWDIQPGSVVIRDPLEGLDVYDALSEGVIDLDDLPVGSSLTAEEQRLEDESNRRLAAQIAAGDVGEPF